MKTAFLSLFCCIIVTSATSQDMPVPNPNLVTLPANSYIIATDTINQRNTLGFFNLKTYGLIVHLLNNNVKVKWVISATKVKDGTDISVNCEQVKPSLIAGPVLRDFKAGPFVIFANEYAGVDALINQFYTNNSLAIGDRPKVYRTSSAVSVDLRYDLTGFQPMAAILNDGGNAGIHTAFMTAASVPAANYTTAMSSDLTSGCFTFASEPHYRDAGAATDVVVSNVRAFIVSGGNFLAQCEALETYENNGFGRFQTTTGLTITNIAVGTTLNYPNPNLSFSQIHGDYNASLGGGTKNWRINASGANNQHHHARGTGANSNIIGASVSKLGSPSMGGLVFYIGNHNFPTTTLVGINGIRMFLNAFLTPSLNCGYTPVPIKLMEFVGSLQNNKVFLKWTVAENEYGSHFEIERSTDGFRFENAGRINNTDSYGDHIYQFTEFPPRAGKFYYRLKVVEKDGNIFYSKVLVLTTRSLPSQVLTLLQNPISSSLAFTYYASTNGEARVFLTDANGSVIFKKKLRVTSGVNAVSYAIPGNLSRGVYLLRIESSNQVATANLIKE